MQVYCTFRTKKSSESPPPKGDKMSKLKFAFKIYDIDNDGFISNGELFQFLKMISSNLKA